jgi:stage II sporulation protein AB (anti-sigma F factor)
MEVLFDARSVNEGLARMLVTAFMAGMNPTLEQLADVKTAVSEAVTNAIIHGYAEGQPTDEADSSVESNGFRSTDDIASVALCCDRDGQQLVVTVEDHGVGIADLETAMQPFYTSRPEWERSGMGFSFMEAFMDRIEVRSEPGEGTKVVMWKYIEGGGGR